MNPTMQAILSKVIGVACAVMMVTSLSVIAVQRANHRPGTQVAAKGSNPGGDGTTAGDASTASGGGTDTSGGSASGPTSSGGGTSGGGGTTAGGKAGSGTATGPASGGPAAQTQ